MPTKRVPPRTAPRPERMSSRRSACACRSLPTMAVRTGRGPEAGSAATAEAWSARDWRTGQGDGIETVSLHGGRTRTVPDHRQAPRSLHAPMYWVTVPSGEVSAWSRMHTWCTPS